MPFFKKTQTFWATGTISLVSYIWSSSESKVALVKAPAKALSDFYAFDMDNTIYADVVEGNEHCNFDMKHVLTIL